MGPSDQPRPSRTEPRARFLAPPPRMAEPQRVDHPSADADAQRALDLLVPGRAAYVEPLGAGLINRTYSVTAQGARFVLQRVNPIFDPEIHYNIAAVTARLDERGLRTPRLVHATDGRPFVDLGAGGVWRLLTFVPGVSFDAVRSPAQARSAGALVGRFHAALADLPHRFVGLRQGVHDTARHLALLDEALRTRADHRLAGEAIPLGRSILDGAGGLPPLPPSAPRVGHGDLKFNNLLFAGDAPPACEQPLCLVDLDTVGPMALGHELGDALRSWCNPHGEERVDAVFDRDLFAAALRGYADGLGRALDGDEQAAVVLGVEWIALELAARFCADALRESYFGWDQVRFPGRGEHNLLRARSQWALFVAARAARADRARLAGA